MTRRLPILLVVLLAVPLAAAPRIKTKTVPSLVGTAWSGNTWEKQTMVFEFHADGQINVTYNGAPVKDCAWKQDGESVHVEINNKYLEFDGKLQDGKVVGHCHNVAGTQWDVVLTPVNKDR